MVVTERTRTNTDGQAADSPARPGRRGLDRGSWPDAVAALAAVLTLIGGIWGWQWLNGKEDKGPTVTIIQPTAPPTATTDSSPAVAPASAPPATVDETYLDTLTPVGGSTVPLPAGLDRSRYPHAVVIGCPTNQTGDAETVVKYQLFRRYRTLSAEVSGWSEGGQPFRVQVQVATNTTQRDGTPVHRPGERRTPVVNSAPVPLTAALTASGDAGRAGVGADELELHVGCDQPHDVVILSNARLRD